MMLAVFGYVTGYNGSFPFESPGELCSVAVVVSNYNCNTRTSNDAYHFLLSMIIYLR